VRPFESKQIALLKTFADQAAIAIENARLGEELAARNTELTGSLDRERATGEILRVIAAAPVDLTPVFDAILSRARSLSGASYAVFFQLDGETLRVSAHQDTTPEWLEAMRRRPAPLHPESPSGLAALERRVVFVEDTLATGSERMRELASAQGFRSLLAVPVLKSTTVLGVITLGWPGVIDYPEQQIPLLEAFADQAVIAIENVRLFKKLEERNRDLTTALDQQTATSEILRVISGSPTDSQPVFDAIVQSAQRLLRSQSAGVFLRVGEDIHVAGYTTTDHAGDAELRSQFSMPLSQMLSDNPGAGRAWTDAVVVQDPDIEADRSLSERAHRLARARGFRSRLVAPMRRENPVIGIVVVTRREAGRFAEDEVALLQTFADQAVIAIENVRLFKELEAKNRDLTTALDQQTATSEILRVISQSQTDVQPVFDVIVENAARLSGAPFGGVYRLADGVVYFVAGRGPSTAMLSGRIRSETLSTLGAEVQWRRCQTTRSSASSSSWS
jgi:two-component system NtrC family sensor kinase